MRLFLPHKSSSRFFVILAVVVAVLVIARAALPIWITDRVNRTINGVAGLEGGVSDVDLHLWRGAYTISDLEIRQVSDGHAVPVLSVPTVKLSVQWGALLDGAVVGEVELHRPRINIVAGREREEKRGAGTLAERFRELSPLRVNRFALIDAELHFRNFAARPNVDIFLDDVELEARNLTNSESLSDTLVATVNATGRAMHSGKFDLDMKLDPFERRPTYELAFQLEGLKLPELNTFLQHYLAVVARDGWLSMYTESTAKDGRFHGYVKPIVRDLDILHLKRERDLSETIKGFFAKVIGAMFENDPQEQLATRIEFSGSFENPDVDIWEAVGTFLRNAFVRALEPGVEGTVAPEEAQDVRDPPADGKR